MVETSPSLPSLAELNEDEMARRSWLKPPKALALLCYYISSKNIESKIITWVITPSEQRFLVALLRALQIAHITCQTIYND